MDIRENNAQYDEDMGDIYDKCDWCFKLILTNRYILRNGELSFCSDRCRRMAKWSMKQYGVRNKKTDADTYLYEQLKNEMTKDYELLRRRRGY